MATLEDRERIALEEAIARALAMADRVGAHLAAIHLCAALETVRGNNGPWTEDDALAVVQHHIWKDDLI